MYAVSVIALIVMRLVCPAVMAEINESEITAIQHKQSSVAIIMKVQSNPVNPKPRRCDRDQPPTQE
jgi:hypothetical protein